MPSDADKPHPEIRVTQGGRLRPDDAQDAIGPGDYSLKQNFRREGDYELEREGWQYFAPNGAGNTTNQRTAFSGTGASVDAIHEVRRGNGEIVLVAICAAQGKIKWFDYANSVWTEIGTGFATTGIRRWQVVPVGPFVVFNNGADIPHCWVIGDASTTPLYELREQGISCVGDISESNGVLICSDLRNILDAELAGILNGPTPYGVVPLNKTERVAYQYTWSNFGDPRDFAAVVAGSITAGSPTLTTAWPMASFKIGDQLTILGAGVAGGNLVAPITNISGATVTLGVNAVTTVSGADVQKTTAIDSIVGYGELEDDGSAILAMKSLANRIVAYKASGQIFVGYYSGDLDQPFIFDRVYAPRDNSNRGLVFVNTLVEVGGRYHLYAGANDFYTFSIGTQEPKVHPVLRLCRRSLFFSRVSAADMNRIYASVNGCTEEVFFAYPHSGGYSALAYHYTEGEESCDEIPGFAFASAATVRAPSGAKSSSELTLWFVLGGYDGLVSVYGRSNLATLTMTRHGSAFTRILEFGFSGMGDAFNEKRLRSYVPLIAANGAGGQLTLKLYGASRITQSPTLLLTKALLTDGDKPGLVPMHYQKIYFKDRLETQAGTGVRVAGRIIELSGVRGRSITRIAT